MHSSGDGPGDRPAGLGDRCSSMEIPLIIQDGAMLNPDKGMRLDKDTAFKYVEQITEVIEKVGGVLTLLWHPNHILKEDWWRLYLRIPDYLKAKNAWFGTVRKVGGQAVQP